jgi:hypothetical protein
MSGGISDGSYIGDPFFEQGYREEKAKLKRERAERAVSTKFSSTLQSMPPEVILKEIAGSVEAQKLQIKSMSITQSAVNEARVFLEINLARGAASVLPGVEGKSASWPGKVQPPSPNSPPDPEKAQREAVDRFVERAREMERAKRKVPEGTRDLDLDEI